MAWYHWLAAYMLIAAFFIFVVVPEKPPWLVGLIVAIGVIAILLITRLPGKEDPVLTEYEKKHGKPPE